jgi:GTPase SAR1 family protein
LYHPSNQSINSFLLRSAGFRALAPLYYRDASGALIVYDMSRRETFDKVKSWLDELDSKESVPLCKYIVASKKDLEENREVPDSEGRAFAEQNGCKFFEVSSKTGEGLVEMFDALGADLIREAQKHQVLVHNKQQQQQQQ